MREKLSTFAVDVTRLGPLATVSFATLVCLPSLFEFVARRLALTSMLERYCAAFVLATIGVRAISSVLVRYAIKSTTEALEVENAAQREPRGDGR